MRPKALKPTVDCLTGETLRWEEEEDRRVHEDGGLRLQKAFKLKRRILN